MELADFVNFFLGVLTVFGQISIVTILILLLLKKGDSVLDFIANKSLMLTFVVALVATLGSLTYSDILGYIPCKLCWLQRILMYPQVILLGMAIYKKERAILDYVLGLSIVGGIIALYHYMLQLGLVPSLICNAVSSSESCAQRFVMEFGYITIPLMALTAFLMIITTILVAKSRRV